MTYRHIPLLTRVSKSIALNRDKYREARSLQTIGERGPLGDGGGPTRCITHACINNKRWWLYHFYTGFMPM
jgi:hypothetical protein